MSGQRSQPQRRIWLQPHERDSQRAIEVGAKEGETPTVVVGDGGKVSAVVWWCVGVRRWESVGAPFKGVPPGGAKRESTVVRARERVWKCTRALV